MFHFIGVEHCESDGDLMAKARNSLERGREVFGAGEGIDMVSKHFMWLRADLHYIHTVHSVQVLLWLV